MPTDELFSFELHVALGYCSSCAPTPFCAWKQTSDTYGHALISLPVVSTGHRYPTAPAWRQAVLLLAMH